jgi:uncharacterized protein YegP (UPF0339 family)
MDKSDEQFLWEIANEVEELLLNQANRKVFEQYADEFHKEWSLYKKAMMQWGAKARECIEKASKDERWRNEKAGPPETGYEWDGAHCCWLQPSPILPTLRLKIGHGGIVPRDAIENLKRSYLWLIIIHDAELQKCVPPIDKNYEPLAGHIGIFEGNLAVRNKHVLLGSETYSGRRLIETALTEVKSDIASTKAAETKQKVERRTFMVATKSSKENWEAIKSEYDISKKDFGKKINFVKDPFKRKVIFRDVEHAFVLASQEFSKPAIILAGGVIEELLRLYLEHKNIPVTSDRFVDYIKTCEDKGFLKRGVLRLTDSVRDFRNLVHLANEKAKRHTISKATAKGAVSSIFTIANDFQ